MNALAWLAVPAAVTAYTSFQMSREPVRSPRRFLADASRSGARPVVFLGDSLTQARIGASYIAPLAERWEPRGVRFVNAGVNGDLAYNLLQRLDPVIACDPADVIILVGSNDATGSLTPSNQRNYRRVKKLPEPPSRELFLRSYAELLHKLRAGTSARIALASPPPCAGPLDTPNNRKLIEYSEIVRALATETGSAYLPVFEEHREYLRALPELGRPYLVEGEKIVRIVLTGYLRYALGLRYEAISRLLGSPTTVDGLHMNPTGAMLISRVMERYLEENHGQASR